MVTADQWSREANDMKNVLESRLNLAVQENALHQANSNEQQKTIA